MNRTGLWATAAVGGYLVDQHQKGYID